MDSKRYERLRKLVSGVNKQRKKQSRQIDILCNDFVAAQRDFVKKFDTVVFTANFYRAIAGISDINALIYISGKLIRDEMDYANVSFFLGQEGNYRLYVPDGEKSEEDIPELESSFTGELVNNVIRQNRTCGVEELLEMGLQCKPADLSKVWAVTIPLGEYSHCFGFMLLYLPKEQALTVEQVNRLSMITPGLSRSIMLCQTIVRSA